MFSSMLFALLSDGNGNARLTTTPSVTQNHPEVAPQMTAPTTKPHSVEKQGVSVSRSQRLESGNELLTVSKGRVGVEAS